MFKTSDLENAMPPNEETTLTNRWVAIAFLTFLASTALLSLQAPFYFHEIQSADTVYHAARIDRLLLGQAVVDPFSGTETIYPPLFHLIGALLASLFQLNGEGAIRALGIVSHLFLSSSLLFFSYGFFQNMRLASLFFLFFSFIQYAPATKYLLLQGPATFSHPLVFFGMGAFFFFQKNQKRSWLVLSSFLLSLACQMWWFNLFLAAPFLSIGLFIERKSLLKGGFLAASLSFLLPFLVTFLHLYSIRETLPLYLIETKQEKRALIPSFLSTLFLKGQADYLEALPPWKWSYDPNHSWMKTGRDIINFIFYFFLSLPSSIFILSAAAYLTFKKWIPLSQAFLLFGTLFFSIFLLMKGNTAHLYRVQLYTNAFALLLLMHALSFFETPSKRYGTGLKFLASCAVFFTLWHVLHNPLTIGKAEFHSSEDREAALFIEGIQKAKDQRVFFTDSAYRSLVVLTPFYSLVGNKSGSYYFQDPVSSFQMEEAYTAAVKEGSLQEAIERFHIRFFGFDNTDPTDRLLLKRYRNQGEVVFENKKWTLIHITDYATESSQKNLN